MEDGDRGEERKRGKRKVKSKKGKSEVERTENKEIRRQKSK